MMTAIRSRSTLCCARLNEAKTCAKQRETLSSVSLTCFGGVSSDLPFKAIQILQQHGIIADKYVCHRIR